MSAILYTVLMINLALLFWYAYHDHFAWLNLAGVILMVIALMTGQ